DKLPPQTQSSRQRWSAETTAPARASSNSVPDTTTERRDHCACAVVSALRSCIELAAEKLRLSGGPQPIPCHACTRPTDRVNSAPAREPRRGPRTEATRRPSGQHQGGVLQTAPDVGEEPRDDLAVDDTMVGTDRQRGDLSRHDLIVDDPRLL